MIKEGEEKAKEEEAEEKASDKRKNSCKSVTWSAVPSASIVSLKLNYN